MANNWAVADRLNGYQCFGPSADEYPVVSFRLP